MVFVEASPITLEDKVFSTAELQILVTQHRCCAAVLEDCFSQVSLSQSDLCDPKVRISLKQWLQMLTTCCHTQQDPLLALRVGRQMHLTAYGIVGFALLSSASLNQALDVANEFALLINLKQMLRLELDGELAHIQLSDNFSLLGADKYFSTLLETAKVLTLLRDILGHGFTAQGIRLNLSAGPLDAQTLSLALGAPVSLNCPDNTITFSTGYVEQPLPQSHSMTHHACKALCATQLQEVSQRYDLCYRVQKMLLASPCSIPTLSEVASQLHLSPRTLRRKLEATQNSYNQILEDVRKKLAIRYLLETPMTTEAISERLSYSDAANFRHAFKRWTGTAPRAFRSQNRDSDWIAPDLHTLPGPSTISLSTHHAYA
jgi:AraC-like DNA-binding protein